MIARRSDTESAAAAILHLFDMFGHAHADLGLWIEELADDWPDLAAELFTLSSGNTGKEIE